MHLFFSDKKDSGRTLSPVSGLQKFLRFLYRNLFKMNDGARLALGNHRKICGAYRSDFSISACGLPVCHEDDRPSGGGDLNGAEHDTVGDDITSVTAGDRRTVKAAAHPVTFLCDGISLGVNGVQSGRGKLICLRTFHDTKRYVIGIFRLGVPEVL